MITNVPLGYMRRPASAIHRLMERERWSALVLTRPRTDRQLLNPVSWEAGAVLDAINPRIGVIALADLVREMQPFARIPVLRFLELAVADRYAGLWLVVEAEATLLAIGDAVAA